MNSSEPMFVKGRFSGSDAPVELKNGRFVDVINGRYFSDGLRIIINGKQIEAMPAGSKPFEIPPERCIDLSGKTVLPGLFNVHCHLQMVNPTLFSTRKTARDRKQNHDRQVEKALTDCLACGITNVRDAFSDNLEANRVLRDRIVRNEIPGPRIQQAVLVGPLGGYLSPDLRGMKKILIGLLGLGSFKYDIPTSGVIVFQADAPEQQIRDAVDRAIDERGADLIKVGESLEESILNTDPQVMTQDQLSTIADQARRRGVQSTIHSVSVSTFNRAVKAGFSSLAHMARDKALSEEDIKICQASEVIIDPTLSVAYDLSWKLPDNPFSSDSNMELIYRFREKTYQEIASRYWLPELQQHVTDGFEKATRGKYKMLGLISLNNLLRHYCRLIRHGVDNTRLLHREGVTMACGNDGGIQSCTPAMIAHELAVTALFLNSEADSLFDGVQAVKAATINSARSMGIEDRFGSLEVGKTADLVVIDGDPFSDAGVIGSPVEALFMDGELVIDNCGLLP